MSGVVKEPEKAQVGYAGGLFKASEKKNTLGRVRLGAGSEG